LSALPLNHSHSTKSNSAIIDLKKKLQNPFYRRSNCVCAFIRSLIVVSMEVNDQNLNYLQNILQNALSHDNTTRKGAEVFLEQYEGTPGFLLLVLSLVSRTIGSTSPQDAAIRQSASVLFKNIVKRRWVSEEDDKPSIASNDKELIKNNLVELMTSAPSDVQKQLAEGVSIISKYDFPNGWTTLLPQLVANLAKGDILVNRGVMLTANSIMKRYRYVAKSDDLFTEILYCLTNIAGPLQQQFQQNGELVQKYGSSIRELVIVMETQRLIARIFYSLNWQDIPEVFEDNVQIWMTEFAKFLTYTNPFLVDNDEELESGPIERLQAAILDNISLYATKYEDVFEPFLPQFTQLVWKLLIDVDSKPKYDILATSAIKFLTSVSSKQHNVGLFSDAVLRDIVEHIVVKNLTASENDEELFEDNPTDYIRKDFEGSDSDSRRRCAIDLVRSLLRFFGPQVSALCSTFIQSLLQQYAATKDWRLKDAALHLLFAVGVTSGNMTTGASVLNPAVDVITLFTQHVLPELQSGSVDDNEIIKADTIKLVCFFRTQLPLTLLLSLLPQITRFFQSKHVVLQTYAAICVEKFLVLKERDANNINKPRLTKSDLAPLFQPLFAGLFAVLDNPSLSENEHVMKCIMRVLAIVGDDINNVFELVLMHLVRALEKVCKNPVNPHYNHYLFECLALSVAAACGTGQNTTEQQLVACGRFESLLFPIFQAILGQDITEFVPYVFQILAQLLSARPLGYGLSDAYRALFPPLLSPALWERKGNVIALVDLFKAYLSRGMKEIIATGQLTGVLGVFQKLLSAKVRYSPL
jgi:exportin-2 (importin alpha re-exporter)